MGPLAALLGLTLATLGEPSGCLRLAHPLAAGATLGQDDVAPAACETDRPATAFRYDPALRSARAVRDLAAGEVVRAVPAFALVAVRPGQTLYLKSRSGPVVVEREVVALQPARAGGRLFVRAADGQVFAADLGDAAP